MRNLNFGRETPRRRLMRASRSWSAVSKVALSVTHLSLRFEAIWEARPGGGTGQWIQNGSFPPKHERKRRRVECFGLLKMCCVARVIENDEPRTANSVPHLCGVLGDTNTIMPSHLRGRQA